MKIKKNVKVSRFRWIYIVIFAGLSFLVLHCFILFLLVTKLNVISFFLTFYEEKPIKGVNVLVFGIDETNYVNRSDSIIVVHLDSTKKYIGSVSIPRDTRVLIENYGMSKINHAYAYGGSDLLKNTISNFLAVPIDYYVKVELSQVKELVDVIGGVEVDVASDMTYIDYAGDLYINIAKGKQTLTGEQSMQYLRYRQDNEGDLGRVNRQQYFVKQFLNELVSFDSLVKLPGIIKKLSSIVETDMDSSMIVSLFSEFKDTVKEKSIKTSTVPGVVSLINGGYFWKPDIVQLDKIVDDVLFGFEKVKAKEMFAKVKNSSTIAEKPTVSEENLSNGNLDYANKAKSEDSLQKPLLTNKKDNDQQKFTSESYPNASMDVDEEDNNNRYAQSFNLSEQFDVGLDFQKEQNQTVEPLEDDSNRLNNNNIAQQDVLVSVDISDASSQKNVTQQIDETVVVNFVSDVFNNTSKESDFQLNKESTLDEFENISMNMMESDTVVKESNLDNVVINIKLNDESKSESNTLKLVKEELVVEEDLQAQSEVVNNVAVSNNLSIVDIKPVETTAINNQLKTIEYSEADSENQKEKNESTNQAPLISRRYITVGEIKRFSEAGALVDIPDFNGIKCELLNGVGVNGIASKAAKVLGVLGIEVPIFDNAGHFNYKETIILDWHGNIERSLALANYFKIDPENIILYDNPSKPLDVSIVLGADWLEKQELLENIYEKGRIN